MPPAAPGLSAFRFSSPVFPRLARAKNYAGDSELMGSWYSYTLFSLSRPVTAGATYVDRPEARS